MQMLMTETVAAAALDEEDALVDGEEKVNSLQEGGTGRRCGYLGTKGHHEVDKERRDSKPKHISQLKVHNEM